MLLRPLSLGLSLVLLASCTYLAGDDGIFRDRKKDYRKAEASERMVLPEGMQSRELVDHYPVPPLSPYAPQELIDEPPLPAGMAVQDRDQVKLQKLADQQWVLVQMSPSQLWPRLKAFIQQQPLVLMLESGSVGVMEAASQDGVFRFRVEPGLQRNSAELSVRFLDRGAAGQGFWQAVSSDLERESDMLLAAARFLAELAERPAYSFVAQTISSEPRLLVQHNEQGEKYLLLKLGRQRAQASLQLALTRAGFAEPEYRSDRGEWVAMFAPPLPEDQQPGFWSRLFGIKPPPYDRKAEYAGHIYHFAIDSLDAFQRIRITAIEREQEQSAAQNLKEINSQILQVSRLLY